jgi:hypothetical protein
MMKNFVRVPSEVIMVQGHEVGPKKKQRYW